MYKEDVYPINIQTQPEQRSVPEMKNYRIAFFTIDWNYELVESTFHGLWQFVEDHPGVELSIFDCFGTDVDSPRNRSEYGIFNLADLNRFDGLLIQGNQIVLNSARQELERRVAASGIPAVTIDCIMQGCTTIAVDNRSAQRDIADHVIRRHGFRRLVYLTGMLDNGISEGRNRLNGFLDACRNNGIAPEETDIYECTWRTEDGYRLGKRWLEEGKILPDVFVSANDEMALGLMDALKEGDVMIPEDVAVIGFDNIPSSGLSTPRLSTVRRDYARMNYTAMEYLLRKIDGASVPKEISFPYDLILSESCGCPAPRRGEAVRGQYFRQTRFLKNFYSLQEKMAAELFEAADLSSLMRVVEETYEIFGCRNIYLCINDYYFENFDKKQWKQNSETFGREMVLAACGKSGSPPDENHVYARFPTSQLLPDEILRKSRFHVFYPLHYSTYSIGYMALDSISEAAKLNLHESLFSFLEIAIENVRKKLLLHQLNDVLDGLYVHDGLTGLYNRFGYERFAQKTYEALLRSGGAQILFVDMDYLKKINDAYGHEAGDLAIRTAAEVLRDSCAPGDFLMRYGGDEFLVIASAGESGLEEAFRRGAREASARMKLPCTLSLSIGAVRAEAGDGSTLEQHVQAADALMYEAKKTRKNRE